LTLLAVWSAGCDGFRAPAPQPRVNLLLVSIETIRPDRMSAYGYRRATTPHFDRLAREGALFQQVIAQAPFTLPSLASVMTGLNPPRHGVRNHPATLRPELKTLAELLAESGYHTAAMTRHSWLRRKAGFDQGFAEYHNNKFSVGLDARGLSLAALDWLEKNRAAPFFLWLHFIDPHLPYTPAYPYSALFDARFASESQVKHLKSLVETPSESFTPTPYADLEGGPFLDLVLPQYPDNPLLLDLALHRRPRGQIFFGQARYSERTLEEMQNLYDGGLVYTDDNLGRLLSGLDDLGLREKTAVVVVGDHGEALGEHGLYFTHDFTLYDEVLRVPLAVRVPGRGRPGTVVPQQVRLIDLMPTLADLAGVSPPSDLEGVSLVPLLEGRSLGYLPAFAENAPFRHLFPEQARVYYEGNRGKWRMVRTERWKLLMVPHPQGDLFELYDLVSDPGETKNVYHEYSGEAGKLLPLLKAWLATDPERNSTASTEGDLEGLDPAALQQLRAMGYVH
jgi:arylsulfatase A-like enzyme